MKTEETDLMRAIGPTSRHCLVHLPLKIWNTNHIHGGVWWWIWIVHRGVWWWYSMVFCDPDKAQVEMVVYLLRAWVYSDSVSSEAFLPFWLFFCSGRELQREKNIKTILSSRQRWRIPMVFLFAMAYLNQGQSFKDLDLRKERLEQCLHAAVMLRWLHPLPRRAVEGWVHSHEILG